MSFEARPIEVKSSVDPGAPCPVHELEDKAVFIFSDDLDATVQLQGSPDGTHWGDIGAAFTAPGTPGWCETVAVDETYAFVRMNTTIYNAGDGAALVTGRFWS
jgi:hypothetical protein